MQRALSEQDPQARTFWKQVRSYVDFCAHAGEQALEAAANVAVVVDDLDTSDEVMNLLARHNIPFKVFLPSDLRVASFEAFDVVVVFAKRDQRLTSESVILPIAVRRLWLWTRMVRIRGRLMSLCE